MRVIFICMDHYPYSGACTGLLLKMLDAGIKESFKDVHVITIKKSINEPTCEVMNGIMIHRIINWSEISQKELKLALKEKRFLAINGLISKVRINIVKYLKKEVPFLRKNVIAKLRKQIRVLNCTKDDVLIPVAGYYETVSAAMVCKREIGAKLIVYQVDPCSTNYVYSANSKKMRRKYEQDFMSCADAVITTPIILRETENYLTPEILKRVYPMEFPNITSTHSLYSNEATKKDIYNCAFAGMIYRGVRNPEYTLKLFSALNKEDIKLHMVGIDENNAAEYIRKEEQGKNIIYHGRLPLIKTKEILEDADILVNIGNMLKNQVPSKIFEYISMGKPIVNICVHHNCPTLPYLEKYPYVLNLFEEEGVSKKQIQKLEMFILENAGKRVSADLILKNYRECTASHCANMMINIIRKIA